LPEDVLVQHWPLLMSLGFGWGGTLEGTVNARASAMTIQPAAFLGLFRHFGIYHGPALGLPIGLPGSYTEKDEEYGYGLSFAAVPQYQVLQTFARRFFWGAGLGIPLLVATWKNDPHDDYAFTAGLDINAQIGWRFLAGLGAYARLSYDVYFAQYTQTTLGGELGLCLYYEWFRPWEPPAPPEGEEVLP
jgi:hypothetical protein